MNSQEVEMELEENEEDMPRWQRRELQEKRLQQQKERELQKQKEEHQKQQNNSSDSDSDEMPRKRQRNGLRAGLRESINSGSSIEGKPKSVLEELKIIQTANKLRKQMSLNLDSETPSKPQYIAGSYSPQTHACPTWGDSSEAAPAMKKAEMINHRQVFLRQFDDLLDQTAVSKNIQQSQSAELQDKILEEEDSNNDQSSNNLENPQLKATQDAVKTNEKPSFDEFFKKLHQEKQEQSGKSPEASPATSPTPFQFLHKKIKQVLEQEGYMVEGDNISDMRSELKKYQDDIVNQASKEYYSSQDQSLSENASIDQEVDTDKGKEDGYDDEDEDEEGESAQQKKQMKNKTRAEKKKALEREFQKQNSLDLGSSSARPQRSNEMRATLGKSHSFDCINKINNSKEEISSPDQSKSKQQQQFKLIPKSAESGKTTRQYQQQDENSEISSAQKEKRSRNMRTSLGWNAHDSINSKGFVSRDDDDEEEESNLLGRDKKKEIPLVRSVNSSRFKKQNTLDPSALENLLLSKARDSSKENKSNSSERSQKQKSQKDEEDDDEDEEEGDSSNHCRSSNHSEKVLSSGKSSAKNSSEGYANSGKGQKIFKDYCPDEIDDQEDRDSRQQVEDEEGNEQGDFINQPVSSGSQFNNYYQAKSLRNQPEQCEVIEEMESSQESITKSSLIFQKRNRQTADEDKDDDDENKDESTKNKVDDEQQTKVRQIVSNLEHPSTFFHYINMRESKKGRRSSNDFSDSNGSRPVSTPDLRDIDCKFDESFQIDLNNINAKQSSSIILIQSQEQVNLPPPQSPLLSSLVLPQNALSPKRKYSGISQDDSAVNISPKRKISSPVGKGRYQQQQQYNLFQLNDQNGSKPLGENNGIPSLFLTPVEITQGHEEIHENITTKKEEEEEKQKSVSPRQGQFVAKREHPEMLVASPAPLQAVPVNQLENITQINADLLKINSASPFELPEPYLLAKSPSPAARSEQVADTPQQQQPVSSASSSIQRDNISKEYQPFLSEENVSAPWKTVRNFVSTFYSSQNIPSATYNADPAKGGITQIPSKELESLKEIIQLPRINSAPEEKLLNQGFKKTNNATAQLDLDDNTLKQTQPQLIQSPQATSLQTSPVIAPTSSPQNSATAPPIETSKNDTGSNHKTSFIYRKQTSLMSIPDYEPLGKSPSLPTASPDFLANISKFVYPSSSITVLASENTVHENTNNNHKNYNNGNSVVTSTAFAQTTSTVSSTQPLLLNMTESIQVKHGVSADTEVPFKPSATISYIIDSKNSSMLASSTSKTPLIDQFHQVPSLNILFPNNKNNMKYSKPSSESISNLSSSPSHLQSSTSPSSSVHTKTIDHNIEHTLKNGFGSQLNPDGSMYIGLFADGKRQGFGKILDPAGKLFFQGQFISDSYDGEGELHNSLVAVVSSTEGKSNAIDVNTNTNVSWTQYIGQFKSGKKQGFGKLIFQNGDEFSGTFSDDQAQGYGQLTKSTGEIIQGMWKEGMIVVEEKPKPSV